MELIFARIESCIFALSMIAQEVYDESNKQETQQILLQHIKPICEKLLNSNLHKMDMNAVILHLLSSICSFFKGYSFYICKTPDLLQKCLLYTIEIPTKYQPIMAYQCSKIFNPLLYHSTNLWMKQLNDFENVIKFVTEQIGQGQQFYNKISPKHLQLLQDATITDLDDDDPNVIDMITRQQKACSKYYESLCMIIDVYNDKNRQKSLINNLISQPIQICNKILKNLSNNSIQFNLSIFYQINTNLYIFSAFIRGLKTTETNNHPLIPHIEKILNISVNTKQLPLLWQNTNNNNNNNNDDDMKTNRRRNEIKMPQNLGDIDKNLLYDAVCDVLETILDIFRTNTQTILDGLVQTSLHLLKNTKSVSSARLLRKMVETFSVQTNVANNFLSLIKDAIIFFNNGNLVI